MLLPALLVGLLAVHLGTVVRHRRPPGPGRGEAAVAGARRRPERVLASLSLLLLVAAVLILLGGVAQINPVWQLGPLPPGQGHLPGAARLVPGLLDGLVRLAPPWSFELFGYTISEALWPALLFPAVAFGIMTLWPWIERRLGGDRAEHDLLDRPRDAPPRTAVGAAGLTMFLVAFLAAGHDILAVLLHLPAGGGDQAAAVVVRPRPVVVGLVTYAVFRSLRRSGLHPARAAAGLRLERTAAGGYRTAPAGPPSRPPSGSPQPAKFVLAALRHSTMDPVGGLTAAPPVPRKRTHNPPTSLVIGIDRPRAFRDDTQRRCWVGVADGCGHTVRGSKSSVSPLSLLVHIRPAGTRGR
jgi:Cytochrome b(N-terminal)/b6/petB